MTRAAEQPRPPSGAAGGNDVVLRQAILALDGQRPNEAEQIAGRILRSDPRHVEALYVLGCALLMQRRAKDAIAPLEAATRGRNDSRIETELATALRLAGQMDDAIRRLRRVVKRKPPYAAAFLELGIALAATARHDEAIETLNRGIQIAPMAPRLSVELGYLLLHRRDWSGAKNAFAHALAILPDSAETLFGMAKAHQELGDSESAMPYFRRYLTIHPNDERAQLTFGQCLLELGQLDEGYEYFRSAARGDPNRYGRALDSLVASCRGRFWLKPSAAARYFHRPQP